MSLCHSSMHRQIPPRYRAISPRCPDRVSKRQQSKFLRYALEKWCRNCPYQWIAHAVLHVTGSKFESELGQGCDNRDLLVNKEGARDDRVAGCLAFVTDVGVQCDIHEMQEPMSRIACFQTGFVHKIMVAYWQDVHEPQRFYSASTHFSRFETVETLCSWAVQLAPHEIAQLAGRFIGHELAGQSLKRCGRASERHVSEARLLASTLPFFRTALLTSALTCLQSVSSERNSSKVCDFAVRLVKVGALPQAFVVELFEHLCDSSECVQMLLLHVCSSEPLRGGRTGMREIVSDESDMAAANMRAFLHCSDEAEPIKGSRPDGLTPRGRLPEVCAHLSAVQTLGIHVHGTAMTCRSTSLRPQGTHVSFARSLFEVIST